MPENKKFHELFRLWLDYFNMNASEFARRYGCGREAVRQWLQGHVRNPYDSTMEKMCTVLGITVNEFWDGPPLKLDKKNILNEKIDSNKHEMIRKIVKMLFELDPVELVELNKLIEQFHKTKYE